MSKLPDQQPHKFDVRTIAHALLEGWRTIAVCTVMVLILGIIAQHFAYYGYTGRMQVTQPNQTQSNTAPQASNLGGLASLAGVSLPTNQSTSQFRLYLESLYSRDLANELAKNPRIMKALFAGEWDEASSSWHPPPEDTFAPVDQAIRDLLGLPQLVWTPPSGARLQGYIGYAVQLQQDPRKPYLATITYASGDPQFAILFLTALNQAADNLLRQKALQRADQYIDYLTNKLKTVTDAEQRAALLQSLSDQERYAMSAGSAAPFAAELFDNPSVPLAPDAPTPSHVLLKLILIGAIVGCALVVGLKYWGDILREKVLLKIAKILPKSIRRRFGL